MRQEVKKQKLKRNFREWKEWLFAVFFPRCCPVCDKVIPYGQKICDVCKKKVPFIKEPACKKCGKQLENERQEYCEDCSRKKHCFIQGKAIFSYRKEMKLSMYRFKYANKREYADYFAEIAGRKYGDWIVRREIEAIIPIPMFRGKMRQRGYNQAYIFAKALSKELNIPVENRLVYRVKNTVPQKELNDRQRKDNLKGAFQVQANIVEYRKILLVDDIYTTGATMDAVGEVLKAIGVDEIYFLCICIGEGY